MRLPSHTNPQPNQLNRIACAPYNFVEMPSSGKPADSPNPKPRHDAYTLGAHTGHFEVELKVCTPTYVRCALTTHQFIQGERQRRGEGNAANFRGLAKNIPEFFYTRQVEEPVIPGSSLRGMLRNMVEIISYGKMDRVSETRLFYRSLDGSSLCRDYVGRMVDDSASAPSGPEIQPPHASHKGNAKVYRPKVKTGRLRKMGNQWQIVECDVARIEETNLTGLPGFAPLRVGTEPQWTALQKTIWVDVDTTEQNYFFKSPSAPPGMSPRHKDLYLPFRLARNPSLTAPAAGSLPKSEGTLVLTGRMVNKHLAFVFLEPLPTARIIDIPNDSDDPDINNRLVDLFHEHQLTPFQKDVFQKHQPTIDCRDQDGYLRVGEPIFFLEDGGNLVFFGRCLMFRLPYKNRPVDLIGGLYKSTRMDYADAMFGYVRDKGVSKDAKSGSRERALAGRVFVTDARCDQSGAEAFVETSGMPGGVVTPKILASPKPTCFPHYLTQDQPNNGQQLKHYNSAGTTLRGTKRYWHQGEVNANSLLEDNAEHLNPGNCGGNVKTNSKQHTQMKPVRKDATFQFRVYFENLTLEELGALWWALQPKGTEDAEYLHKIGMGKPYGMGSVKLTPTLHLSDREGRYRTLFDSNGGWHKPSANPVLYQSAVAAFETDVIGQYTWDPNPPHALAGAHRIAQLLKMMEWPGIPARKPLPNVGANQQNRHQQNQPNTRYMTIKLNGVDQDQNEYRRRPVLPEPLWSGYGGGATLPRDIERIPPPTNGAGPAVAPSGGQANPGAPVKGSTSPSSSSSKGQTPKKATVEGPWDDCRVKQSNAKNGALTVKILHKGNWVEFPQSQWQPIYEAFNQAQKAAVKAGKMKATVILTHEGGKRKLISLMNVRIESG